MVQLIQGLRCSFAEIHNHSATFVFSLQSLRHCLQFCLACYELRSTNTSLKPFVRIFEVDEEMARSLVGKNLARELKQVSATQDEDVSTSTDGHMFLYSYYKPTLYPGDYGIEAKQTIQVNGEELRIFNYDSVFGPPVAPGDDPITAMQGIKVVAPQFSLDPKLINSCYPPPGHADEGRILPHIVFNDPHVPWFRPPFPPAGHRNYPQELWPPWIALVTFDPVELELGLVDIDHLKIPLTELNPKPSSTGAYSMQVRDYLLGVTSRANFEEGYSKQNKDRSKLKEIQTSTAPVDVIFPPKDLVKEIFDDGGAFAYMSHVRRVNTDGLPDSGDKDDNLYSICVSRRSGPITPSNPLDPPVPRMQTVHLISIECMFDERGNPISPADALGESDRVGLISLYSWNYLSTPPLPNNFVTTMKDLSDKKQVLRPPDPILKSMVDGVTAGAPNSGAAQALQQRLSQGYSITRWRTSTGEETAAFTRSPLTPIRTTPTPSIAKDWPSTSNTGEDYQILDLHTGLMDVTYSSAWQLGKLLAISDTIFSSALLRFRSLVHRQASSSTRMLINAVASSKSIINNTPKVMDGIELLTNGTRHPTRNILPTSDKVAPPFSDPAIAPLFRSRVQNQVLSLAGLASQVDHTPISATPDFEIIRNWISDKLFLAGIRAHYLFTDPSHLASSLTSAPVKAPIKLPSEALRFFYIDDAWLDCLIDGALSVANHLDPLNDTVRDSIKDIYNTYLRTYIHNTSIKPPIPRYGFVLRSTIVKVMPDLRVTVTCRKPKPDGEVGYDEDLLRKPLIQLTKMDDYTIFALVDCLPEDIYLITLAQPPHQQKFVAPIPAAPGVPYQPKRLYTEGAPQGKGKDGLWPPVPVPVDTSLWYKPNTRCVNHKVMTDDLARILPFSEPPQKFSAAIDSTVFALELNDRSYQLEVQPPVGSSPNLTPLPDRQIWTGNPAVSLMDVGSSPRVFRIAPSKAIRPSLKAAGFQASPFRVSARPHLLDLSSTPIISTGSITSIPQQLGPTGIPIPPLSSLYTLSIHPSYRGAAPLPYVDNAITPPRKVFSSKDFIPTGTTHLLDLIFSIRLNPLIPPTMRLLSSTIIIIPFQPEDDDGETPPIATPPEPLLTSPHTGADATMIHNRRFIILLKSAPQQLQIHLIPRSALPGETKGLPRESTQDLSFTLKGCDVPPTVTQRLVEVMGAGGTKVVERGVVKVSMVELYVIGGVWGNAWSEVEVLKKEGGEKDLLGEDV